MKKVLASVLAGTMVLGMASVASAAHGIGLEKATGDDRVYDLLLYAPDGEYVTETTDRSINWGNASIETAYAAYLKEYDAYENASKDFDDLRDYLANRLARGRDTIVDAFITLRTAVGNSTNAAVRNLADGGQILATQKATDMAEYTLANLRAGGAVTNAGDYLNATLNTDLVAVMDTLEPDDIFDAAEAAGLLTSGIVSDFEGNGTYAPHKTTWNISDEDETPYVTNMYTYGEDDVKEVKINVWVQHGDNIRADVNTGKVSVSKKLVEKNWEDTDADVYMFTLKAKADVRDFELSDFEVEFDVDNDDHSTYFLKGQVAYSDYREVDPDDRLTITKSDRLDNQEDGCVFYFNEPIDEEARINCNDYVDLYFDGNYGTDYENLLVVTDGIQDVEDYFQDYDIDYYDFVGTPKFARDVRCIIDADSDAYIYEYDKKTGDVVDITDECEYTSNGMEFKRKSFKTYVILEEPYEGGNVKAEKEPVAEEPEDEPKETEEPKDDTSSEGSKPNPGTGAYPLF